MGDQRPQPLALELEQPVARPAVPGELGTGQGLQPVRRLDEVEVEVVVVMGASPPRAPPCRAAP